MSGIDRRALIAGGAAAAGAALSSRATGTVPPAAAETVVLTVSPSRSTTMTVWRPTAPPRGLALFSHGHGSWPERYGTLAFLLSSMGFAVVAPMHVDSVRYPDRASFTMQASFPERLADMRAASAWARARFAAVPVVAAGHSFGTLTALCMAGALPYLGAFRDAAVGAVLGFSSPGRIPGLVRPDAYGAVAAPLMLVAGTADTVPGFVADPADHLLPVESAAGPAFGIVAAGATHELVAMSDSGIRLYASPISDFLAGYGRADAEARRRLLHWTPRPGDRFIVRNAA